MKLRAWLLLDRVVVSCILRPGNTVARRWDVRGLLIALCGRVSKFDVTRASFLFGRLDFILPTLSPG